METLRLLRNKGNDKEEMKIYEIEGQKEAERILYMFSVSSSNPFTPCGV